MNQSKKTISSHTISIITSLHQRHSNNQTQRNYLVMQSQKSHSINRVYTHLTLSSLLSYQLMLEYQYIGFIFRILLQ